MEKFTLVLNCVYIFIQKKQITKITNTILILIPIVKKVKL